MPGPPEGRGASGRGIKGQAGRGVDSRWLGEAEVSELDMGTRVGARYRGSSQIDCGQIWF